MGDRVAYELLDILISTVITGRNIYVYINVLLKWKAKNITLSEQFQNSIKKIIKQNISLSEQFQNTIKKKTRRNEQIRSKNVFFNWANASCVETYYCHHFFCLAHHSDNLSRRKWRRNDRCRIHSHSWRWKSWFCHQCRCWYR